MLAALKREYLPDLEVSDDGGYWETRDLAELVRNHSMTQAAIDGLAEGLRRYGLSSEAAEDPAILLRHIERVAAHVHRNMHRPAEHPPFAVLNDDSEPRRVVNRIRTTSGGGRQVPGRHRRSIQNRRGRTPSTSATGNGPTPEFGYVVS